MTPNKQIRACFNDETITVYQAYRPAIALAALRAQRFVPPFKLDRMSWIKPSFLWMMYRCGWAQKAGQEHVLAIEIKRTGFEWALNHGCLSSARKAGVAQEEWPAYKAAYPVRIQWDPERDIQLNRLEHRSIQIGLSGPAIRQYAEDWTVRINDVTPLAGRMYQAVQDSAFDEARAMLPNEQPYPTATAWAERLRLTAESSVPSGISS